MSGKNLRGQLVGRLQTMQTAVAKLASILDSQPSIEEVQRVARVRDNVVAKLASLGILDPIDKAPTRADMDRYGGAELVLSRLLEATEAKLAAKTAGSPSADHVSGVSSLGTPGGRPVAAKPTGPREIRC